MHETESEARGVVRSMERLSSLQLPSSHARSQLLPLCKPEPVLTRAVFMQGSQRQSVLDSAPRQRHPDVDEVPGQP